MSDGPDQQQPDQQQPELAADGGGTVAHEAANDAHELLQVLGNGSVRELDGEAGRAVIEFTCAPEMCHTGGIAQGGFVTGWMDAAMAHACIARYGTAAWVASLEIKVSFFRPTGPGQVIAEGWIERAGRQIVFTAARLTDADGKELAQASSTIRLVPLPAG